MRDTTEFGVVAVVTGGPYAARIVDEEAGVAVDRRDVVRIEDDVATIVEYLVALHVARPAIILGRFEQREIDLVLVVLAVELVNSCAGTDECSVSRHHALDDLAECITQLLIVLSGIGRFSCAVFTDGGSKISQEGFDVITLGGSTSIQSKADRMGGDRLFVGDTS
ncbi:hypothetical protein D9M68_423570 [compost metagenome]